MIQLLFHALPRGGSTLFSWIKTMYLSNFDYIYGFVQKVTIITYIMKS